MFHNNLVRDLSDKIEEVGSEWKSKVVEEAENRNIMRESLNQIDKQLSEYRCHLRDIGFTDREIEKAESALDLVFSEQGLALRKDGSLYPSHPIEVSDKLLIELRCKNLDLVIAGLLHDVIEDVETYKKNPKKIQEIYGKNVYELVDGMTNKQLSPDKEKFYKDGLREVLRNDERCAKEVYKNIEYFVGVADKIRDPKICVLKAVDFSSNALNLPSLNHDERVQSRMANKYLALIDEFGKNFGRVFENAFELGIEPESIARLEQKFADAKPQIQSYARKWKYYDAQEKAFDYFKL